MSWWAELRWAEPGWLALLMAVPLAFLRPRRRPAARASLAPGFVLDGLPSGRRVAWLAGPPWLEALGLTALIMALARPVHDVPLPREVEGVEILLCFDRSSSMNETDLAAGRSRVAVARAAAARFVDARPNDRLSLIAFARYPDLLAPSTLDHDAVRAALAGIDLVEPDGPEDLTGIGSAVARGAQILSVREAASKVIVLLTDGAENVATPASPAALRPVDAAALCQAFGVRVYAISIGAEAALHEELRRLAARTGGRAWTAAHARGLGQVFAAIDALERSPLAAPRFEARERFLPFALLGLVLLVVARGLRAGPLEVLP